MHTHNQLEAMVELKGSQHPLRDPLADQAEQELGNIRTVPWALVIALIAGVLLVELGGMTACAFKPVAPNGSFFSAVGENAPSSAEEQEEPEDPEEVADEFAELKLIRPGSEIRLKPMDEVAWEAEGQSSNGFDDLVLAVYLNGEHKAGCGSL
jgi:hypothetical protein